MNEFRLRKLEIIRYRLKFVYMFILMHDEYVKMTYIVFILMHDGLKNIVSKANLHSPSILSGSPCNKFQAWDI